MLKFIHESLSLFSWKGIMLSHAMLCEFLLLFKLPLMCHLSYKAFSDPNPADFFVILSALTLNLLVCAS